MAATNSKKSSTSNKKRHETMKDLEWERLCEEYVRYKIPGKHSRAFILIEKNELINGQKLIVILCNAFITWH